MSKRCAICTVRFCDQTSDICNECYEDLFSVKSQESDVVNRPIHYRQGVIECVDAMRSALTEEEFRGGCKKEALQYIWRERHKNGDEDLRKAIWWLRMATGDDPRKGDK